MLVKQIEEEGCPALVLRNEWSLGEKDVNFLQFYSTSTKMSAVYAAKDIGDIAPPVSMQTGFTRKDESSVQSSITMIVQLRPRTVWISPPGNCDVPVVACFTYQAASVQWDRNNWFVIAQAWDSPFWSDPWMVELVAWPGITVTKTELDSFVGSFDLWCVVLIR